MKDLRREMCTNGEITPVFLLQKEDNVFSPFTADPVKALHFAIQV